MTSIIKSKNILIEFGENPIHIESILDLISNKKISTGGIQSIVIRVPGAVSDPIILNKATLNKSNEKELRFNYFDETENYKAELILTSTGEGIWYRIIASAPEPIWLVEWKLSGLNFDEVIIPALGGQSLKKEMSPDTTLSYKYPFWWNAQFVIGMLETNGLLLHSKDTEPNLKLLRVGKNDESFSLTFGVEAKAPLISKNLSAEWFVDCFGGNWKDAVDIHRKWLEPAFKLQPFYSHPHFPEWANNIKFVLEIWGARKNVEGPNHTFEQMIQRLIDWKKLFLPENTLVYLPGYAENGVDSHAPDYNPSIQCGGENEFKRLVDTAHELGYHVMIHTNVLAMTYTHPLYPEFKRHQVVDAFDRLQGWAMDIDGDWLTEPYFAYINPGAKEWGNLMEKILGEQISKYHIDGVFLDQTLLAFNVSNGPNFLLGMRNHIKKLQAAFPEILFSGEGLHEHVIEALPMAQIHGIDSIAEVHGMEGQQSWKQAHPVSTYLFGKYTLFTAHLLTKYPTHPMFDMQESAYSQLGVIPALCLYNHNQRIDTPKVRQMIKRAKNIHTRKMF
ncbi:MAG: DUF6259 domain-containing protein [Ignavibacteriaceae bacterium]